MAVASPASAVKRPRKRVRPVLQQLVGGSGSGISHADISIARGLRALKASGGAALAAEMADGDVPVGLKLDAELAAVLRMLTTDSDKHQAQYDRFRERIVVAEDHLENDRFAEAIQVYEDVLRRFQPNHYFGELYLGLGCAFVGLQQHAHAVEQFRKGLVEDPANVHLHMNLGLALVVLQEKDSALATFRRASALADEAQEDHYVVQLALYCGQLLEDMGDDQGALVSYEDALKRGPEYSQLCYAKLEQNAKAITYLRKAIDCPQPWPSAFYKLSKMVVEPMEKRKLFALFVAAQHDMAEAGTGPASLLGSKSGLV